MIRCCELYKAECPLKINCEDCFIFAEYESDEILKYFDESNDLIDPLECIDEDFQINFILEDFENINLDDLPF